MKAIQYDRYGAPDVLELRDIDMPDVGDDDVLVRVRAASINPWDWHFMRGTPYVVRTVAGLFRPGRLLGVDMAGHIEAVGRRVTRFRPGDEVFGWRIGTFAQYVTVRQDGVVLPKPGNLTVEQAAAVPLAALTALQALRDKGRIRPGHKVLVNGAAGGVGTFAVQIAKAFGAEVTGVCSTPNLEMIRSIGADQVVDYTSEDFTRRGQRYDLIVDLAGSRPLAETRRALSPRGTLVAVGGPEIGRWVAPLTGPAKLLVRSWFTSQRLGSMLTRPNRDDLGVLGELLESGKVSPVIGRTYPLEDVAAAIRYLETGHAKAKVVIEI